MSQLKPHSKPGRWLWPFLVVLYVVLAVVSYLGWPRFRTWQVGRLLEESVEASTKADYAGAAIRARRALQIHPDSLPACEQLATVFEQAGDPAALDWRRRVIELTHGTSASLIASADSAVRFGKLPIARENLAQVAEADRQNADFQATSGRLALASGDFTEAARRFSEAVQLEPENGVHRVDLGLAQSRSEDFFSRETGRRALAALAARPEAASRSLRGLVASFDATQEFSAALAESEKLSRLKSASFSDRFTRVKLLRQTKDARFANALAALETEVQSKPEDATAVVVWLYSEGLPENAIEWIRRSFPAVAKIPWLRAAFAAALASDRDWPALIEATKVGPWPEVEYGRQAFRAQALREQGEVPLANSVWKNAIIAASSNPEALKSLVQMATEWSWPEAREQTLLALVGSASSSRAALETLSKQYLTEDNTEGLRDLAARLLEANPTDDTAQNDYAILSLLRDADVPRAARLARDLYNRKPDDPIVRSTYGFALHYQGQSEEALQVLEGLPAAKLEEPGFAAYYGIVLAANDRKAEAVHFLLIAREAHLLREERILVEKSLESAGYTKAD